MIYFATADNRLKKLRASDGQVQWDVSLGTVQRFLREMNAVVAGPTVAVARVDIVAFDTATGVPRWKYVAPGLEETGDGPLAADDSTVFAGGKSGHLFAIDSRSGRPRWLADLSESNPNVALFNPSLSGDVVFVCSKDVVVIPSTGKLWAIDAHSGAVRWSYPFTPQVSTQGSACYGSSATWHQLVIQPEQDGRVFAFDRETGAVVWTAPTLFDPAHAGDDARYATIAGNTVIVTSVVLGGSIIGYDAATGVERWRHTEFGGSSLPVAADSTAAFVNHSWLYASYDVQSGKLRWASPRSLYSRTGTMLESVPLVGLDRIFVGGRDGSYALRR